MYFRGFLTLLGTGFLAVTKAHAVSAHLGAHITGISHDNTWFICLPHEGGCFSLKAAAKGKIFPIESGHLKKLFVLNTRKHTLDIAALPKNCIVNIQNHQTLQIRGTLHRSKNGHAQIEHISCRLVG